MSRHPRASGRGAWGGSKSVIEREVVPVLERQGVPITSRKRWATYGNPGSDHHRSQLLAYAVDGGVANAHGLADKIGRRLGIIGKGEHVEDYREYRIKRGGRVFRVQIIAGTHGTGPHLHVGVRRIGFVRRALERLRGRR